MLLRHAVRLCVMKCYNHLLVVDMADVVAIRDSTCVVRKMAKDVGTAIRKSIVVLFLPCLVSFLRFDQSLHAASFCKCFFVTLDSYSCLFTAHMLNSYTKTFWSRISAISAWT